MKGIQENEFIMGMRGRQKNSSLRITVWQHSDSLLIPDSDPRDGFFNLFLTTMIDSYNPFCFNIFSSHKVKADLTCLHIGIFELSNLQMLVFTVFLWEMLVTSVPIRTVLVFFYRTWEMLTFEKRKIIGNGALCQSHMVKVSIFYLHMAFEKCSSFCSCMGNVHICCFGCFKEVDVVVRIWNGRILLFAVLLSTGKH